MIPSPRQLAESFGLIAKKNLGQNFLFDLNVTRQIVDGAGDISGLNIIEVGPGPGGLTQAILERDIKHLYAIEFDERAIEALKSLNNPKLDVIQADALHIDLRKYPQPCAIMANLPYNIATKLLTNWLEYPTYFKSMTLMFQKEVAERIAAVPRTKDYGRLSVITQWLCETEILFDIPPHAFVPAPKVTSSVIRITPRKQPLFPADKKKLENVLRVAFGQRRKMLRSSLKSLNLNWDALGIDPSRRAEELSIEEFCKIANI